MARQPAQIDHELDAVRRFVTGVDCDPPIAIWHRRDPPAADLELVFADGSTAGLEITRIGHGIRTQGAAIVESICDELKANLRAAGVLGVFVMLSFIEGGTLAPRSRAERSKLVAALVTLVQKHRASGRSWHDYERDLPYEDDAEELPPEPGPHPDVRDPVLAPLRAVTISPLDEVVVTWGTHVRGWGHPFVQACIDKKNEKIARYRAEMPDRAIWLLLVNDAMPLSGVPRTIIEDHTFVSTFERVFCLNDATGVVFPVPTRRG